MPDRPSGTVTFLFTDIEGSTRLWDNDTTAMQAALVRHDAILRGAIDSHGGYVFSTGGDGVGAAFQRAADALAAAIEAQRALNAEPWDERAVLRVRMGLHTGETHERDGDYFGPPVNTAARVMGAGHGGQILVSGVTAALAGSMPGVAFGDLGEHALKGLREPLRLFGVSAPGHEWIDRPLAVSVARLGNLPVPLTDYVGDLIKVAEQIGPLAQRRVVTLTGPGGVGKTRTATELAWTAIDDFPAGAWFVDLAAVSDADAVVPAVATAMDIRLDAGVTPLDALVDWVRGKPLLLLVDNCEHVLSSASRMVSRLVESSPSLTVLATSREPLGVRGERIHHVGALDPDAEAVELFVERAKAADDSFTLGAADRATVASICSRLDGMPLAIELAAARIRSTTPADLLHRLEEGFRVLRTGDRSAPSRHQTLRATIEWSYRLLSDDERLLFDQLAVFAPGFDRAAVEAVCTEDGVDALDVADQLDALVDKSMVIAERGSATTTFRLLETLREFAGTRLDERGTHDAVAARHAAHYVEVARATRARTFGPQQADASLEIEAAWPNLSMAVRWCLGVGDVATANELVGITLYQAIRLAKLEHRDWARRTITAAEQRGQNVPFAHGAAANWSWIEGDPSGCLRHAQVCLSGDECRRLDADVSYVETWICRGLAEINLHRKRSEETEAQLVALSASPVALVRAEALRTRAETLILRDPVEARGLVDAMDAAASEISMPTMDAEVAYLKGMFMYLHPTAPDLQGARAWFEENVRLARLTGDRDNLAVTGALICAVDVAAHRADVAAELRAALQLAYDDRHWNSVNKVLAVVAVASARAGRLAQAATLTGYLDTHHHRAWHTTLDEAREATSEDEWSTARTVGANAEGSAIVEFAMNAIDELEAAEFTPR